MAIAGHITRYGYNIKKIQTQTEHNKQMVNVRNLKFNGVWENPLFIWSILQSRVHVRIEIHTELRLHEWL